MKLIKNLIVVMLFFTAFHAHAALYDRGKGMIYDSTQNITWLRDANYAATSGASTDDSGVMTWYSAWLWTSGLVYGGYSDWRFASANPNYAGYSGPCCAPTTYDGSTDFGYNNTRSEIGHLFAELGNVAQYNTMGVLQSGYGFLNTTFVDAGTGLTSSFLNVQIGSYLEEESARCRIAGCNFIFSTNSGEQNVLPDHRPAFIWVVRDGDVTAVPLPSSVWFFGSSLVLMLKLTNRKARISSRN